MCPLKGLTIMNDFSDIPLNARAEQEFPSPTGVNYYELNDDKHYIEKREGFPSPTGVNYYEYGK